MATGLRDRKKAELRRALRSAALRLAAERGVAGVTVEAIADAVDVAPRTFFNYFSSREEAFVFPDRGWVQVVTAELLDRPSDETPLQALETVFMQVADELVEGRAEFVLRAELIRSEPSLLGTHLAAFANYERALSEAIAQRMRLDVDADLYPGLLAAAGVAAMRVAALHCRPNSDADALRGLVSEAFALLDSGLRAPVGTDA
jgi:AcrR family transcriptional regulator